MSLKLAGFIILFSSIFFDSVSAEDKKFLKNLETKLEDKLCTYAIHATKLLEDYNDRNLGQSEVGKLFGYENMKPKFTEETARKGKSMKKMSMALVPLLFHIGASSTWMLITTLLAAKSVVIGLMLLIFKIAVSSAKVASFFTSLKAKHHPEYSWSPPIEHGHYRSLDGLDHHLPDPHYHNINTGWVNEPPTNDYKTIPVYERISKTYKEMNGIDERKIGEVSHSRR